MPLEAVAAVRTGNVAGSQSKLPVALPAQEAFQMDRSSESAPPAELHPPVDVNTAVSAELQHMAPLAAVDAARARLGCVAAIPDPLQRINEIRRELQALLSETNGARTQTLLRMYQIQCDMQQASLGVEMLAKSIEQGVSGIKTVLQTQS